CWMNTRLARFALARNWRLTNSALVRRTPLPTGRRLARVIAGPLRLNFATVTNLQRLLNFFGQRTGTRIQRALRAIRTRFGIDCLTDLISVLPLSTAPLAPSLPSRPSLPPAPGPPG